MICINNFLSRGLIQSTLRSKGQTRLLSLAYRFFKIALLSVLFSLAVAGASPSAFPETATYFRVGYSSGLEVSVGAELILPVSFVDASAGIEAYFVYNEIYGVRLDGTTLLFPALGTAPPIAVGLGADMNLKQSSGFAIHAGPVLGTDLLFVVDLPIVVSLYVAPGYVVNEGFSLAWYALLRYYSDDLVFELSSSDISYLSVAVRYVF